ncbi:MAG: hypothetical protein KKB62_03530 [Nanoarchaeota archaeon]|nr:hypothetical protein [Nanoarchaeota archaeon]
MEKQNEKNLIHILPFKVIEANYYNKVLRGSNQVAGPGHSSWITGILPYANFKVEGERINEIKEIEFYGEISGIKRGTRILAHIHGYDLKEDDVRVKRDFKEKEIVSKIEKLGFDGKVLAIFNGLEECLFK